MLQVPSLGAEPGFQYMPSDSNVATAFALVEGSAVGLPPPDGGGVGSPPPGFETTVLLMVTLRCVDEVAPWLSVATAISVAVPFGSVVVSMVPEYGAAVLVSTSLVPTYISTLATEPPVSEAVAA